MRILRTIWLPLLTAIAGCLVGVFVASRYWLRDGTRTAELRDRVSALQHVRALRQARSGNTEALVGELEALLDGDIIGLGASSDASMPNHQESREALRKVARYRKEFPYSSGNSELTNAVNQALSLVTP